MLWCYLPFTLLRNILWGIFNSFNKVIWDKQKIRLKINIVKVTRENHKY